MSQHDSERSSDELWSGVMKASAIFGLLCLLLSCFFPTDVREWPTNAVTDTSWQLESETINGVKSQLDPNKKRRAYFKGRDFVAESTDGSSHVAVRDVPLQQPQEERSARPKANAQWSDWTFETVSYIGNNKPHTLEVSYKTPSGQTVNATYKATIMPSKPELTGIRAWLATGVGIGLLLFLSAAGARSSRHRSGDQDTGGSSSGSGGSSGGRTAGDVYGGSGP